MISEPGCRSHAVPEGPLRSALGRVTVKLEPLPSRLSTVIVPRMRSMTCLTMERPRPVPPTSRERVLSTL